MLRYTFDLGGHSVVIIYLGQGYLEYTGSGKMVGWVI